MKKIKVKVDGETSDGCHTFNELYEHRYWLFISLANRMKKTAWKSYKHDDGSVMNGMFIAGFNTPKGMITYHLPNKLYKQLRIASRERAPKWDGHTSNDVIERLMSLPRK